jgi:hypothetical protein
MQLSPYYAIFRRNNDCCLFDYDQLIMAKPYGSGIFPSGTTLYYLTLLPGKFLRQLLLDLYQILSSAIRQQGNAAYRQISLFKTMCPAVMLYKFEPIRISGEFVIWLKKELNSEQKSHVGQAFQMFELADRTSESFEELHGFFRLWGNQTVHEVLRCEKTRVIGQTRYEPLILLYKGKWLDFCSANFTHNL